jgi:hypothetical protein
VMIRTRAVVCVLMAIGGHGLSRAVLDFGLSHG